MSSEQEKKVCTCDALPCVAASSLDPARGKGCPVCVCWGDSRAARWLLVYPEGNPSSIDSTRWQHFERPLPYFYAFDHNAPSALDAQLHTAYRGAMSDKLYKELVRTVARVFYSGEVPPREQVFEMNQNAGLSAGETNEAKKDLKAWVKSYEGLGVVLLDYLTSDAVDGFVDENVIAEALRLSSKFIRKTLRYLQEEHLLVSESVKYSIKRTNNVEEPDDPDIEVRKRSETHVFWAVDYPRVVDVVQLKIHTITELLKRNSGNKVSIMTYQCPACGASYTSLQAASLIDMSSGVFRCEDCKGMLEERGGEDVAGFIQSGNTSSKERQNFFKDLALRFERQVQHVQTLLLGVKGTNPPDPGSLKDWYTIQKNKTIQRAKRLEEARAKFKSSGKADELTEEQLLEWADRAEIVINKDLDEEEGQGKELPSWFQNAAVSEEVSDAKQKREEAEKERATEEQRRLQMEYLQAYLKQVEEQRGGAARVGGVEDKGAVNEVKEEEKEAFEGGVKDLTRNDDEAPPAKKFKPDEEDEDMGWEDA